MSAPRSQDDAAGVVASLRASGIAAVAVTIVDNAGIARVKTVPLAGLERAARWGVGLSPVFDVCTVDDAFTSTGEVDGPTGDLRLLPDLGAARVIAAQPGWAWAPADQRTQDDEAFGCCQRSFARRMAGAAAARGLELRVGSELEWFLGRDNGGDPVPADSGPAYGFAALAEVSEYARELIAAFVDSGIEIGQFHPEYVPGQLEVSLPLGDPVAAGDLNVVSRQLIRAVSAGHGWRASFSPVVVPEQVGNGGHLHFSLWRDGGNLLAGGHGPHGMTETGEAFIAGVLAELPALMAVGAPSVASYLRMKPSHWAGVYGCWGRENREAAVRFVTGMTGSEPTAANCEVKCFDPSANPYLAIGAVIAAGLAGADRGLGLPAELLGDPAERSPDELRSLGVERLPTALDQSLGALEQSKVIPEAMGPMLFDAFLAVRRAEWETFGDAEPAHVAAAHRWRY